MEIGDSGTLQLATLKDGMPTVPPSFGEWLSRSASVVWKIVVMQMALF
jgi:hypothetical protein